MVKKALQAILALSPLFLAITLFSQTSAGAQQTPSESIVFKVEKTHERLEMIINTSRILALDKKIPQAQVNNPNVLTLTPLSPTQVQVAAKAAGVTQVNLWDENQQIYTVDVIVFGDGRELASILQSQFPDAALKVVPVANGVLISGYVDRPEHVSLIVKIAEEYYPKVLNNITVGGVQQVLLHVKAMEVSRTKLRALGMDWSTVTGRNLVASTVAGVMANLPNGAEAAGAPTGTGTFRLNIVNGASTFYGLLEALREDKLMKVLSEPTLVTVSGRPAFFQVGGEVPTLVPQSLGTVSVEYKKYGTQVDFVPIVLGNGQIRLEVRPRVSDIDNDRSIQYSGYTIYAFRTLEEDTGVELKAGQTLAIAGLVQTRVESMRRGIPWVSELPYLGAMFRKVEETNNEIEVLIFVTPEVVDAMDPHEVPPCGPGSMTDSPNDWQLYMRGHIEVPKCCPACQGTGCEQCSPGAKDASGEAGSTEALPGMILEEVGPTKPPAANPTPKPPAPPKMDSDTTRFGRPATKYSARPQNRQNPTTSQVGTADRESQSPSQLPGFIGPVGYDVVR